MKKSLRMLFVLLFCCVCCFNAIACSDSDKTTEFYDCVVKSQELLDSYADDIYDNWYNAIYNDKFSSNINLAIASASAAHYEDIETLKTNDEAIKNLYKSTRDGKYSENVKAVMSAYSDYYEFVINVSGSFKSFSADKETKKKTLASELKKLQLEL